MLSSVQGLGFSSCLKKRYFSVVVILFTFIHLLSVCYVSLPAYVLRDTRGGQRTAWENLFSLSTVGAEVIRLGGGDHLYPLGPPCSVLSLSLSVPGP